MKKIVLLSLCISFVLGANIFAEENSLGVSFSNELSSDTAVFANNKVTFEGIADRAVVDFTSEKVDVGLDATFRLNVNSESAPYSIGYSVEDFDWYFIFKPIKVLSLSLHEQVHMAGSFLAVDKEYSDDGYTGSGNAGSEGFTLSVSAIPNLKLIATIPFYLFEGQDNFFNEYNLDGNKNIFNIGFGVEYNFFEIAYLGVTAHNVADVDHSSYGVYAAVNPIAGLNFYAGYAYRDYIGIHNVAGDNLFNFSASYEIASVYAAVDFATTIDNYYAGAFLSYDITEKVKPEILYVMNGVYNDENYLHELTPAVTYKIGFLGDLKGGVKFNFTSSELVSVCIPVSWKYEF